MKIYQFASFEEMLRQIPLGKEDFSLTIGNFDGVHLGHQALLKQLNKVKPSVVFTFSNHPAALLAHKNIPMLTTLPHRLSLLEKEGVDIAVVIPFTESLSKISAEDFLTAIRKTIPFNSLILGHDAAFGHERKGDSELLTKFSKKEHFMLHYIEPFLIDGTVVSSRKIRQSIEEGNLDLAKNYLGRPFSILAPVIQGTGIGKSLGFQTANIDVSQICLPPFGVWIVEVKCQKNTYAGVANLGFAPTLHEKRSPILEVHFFDFEQSIYGEEIEVIFLKFVRLEKKFSSKEELHQQIHQDVSFAKSFFAKR